MVKEKSSHKLITQSAVPVLSDGHMELSGQSHPTATALLSDGCHLAEAREGESGRIFLEQ